MSTSPPPSPAAEPRPSDAALRPQSPTVVLGVADTAVHRRLRTALMMLGVVPESLSPVAALARLTAPSAGRDQPVPMALDLGAAPARALRPLTTLSQLAPAQRAELLLFRSDGPPVSAAEQDWARELGLAGFVADGTSLADQPGWMAWLARMAPPRAPCSAVQAATHADRLVPPSAPTERARQRIAAVTGQTPEACAAGLASDPGVADRRWHLRLYRHCLVASEAVTSWSQRWRIERGQAVQLGRDLVRAGVLRHVADEHEFADELLFFEPLDPACAREPGLAALRAALQGADGGPGVARAERSHLGKAYPDCWIGSEAVDAVLRRWPLSRGEATTALQRLWQLGEFEHVLDAHPLRDGHYFYRFTGRAAPEAP